jgi:acetoin utilization protein AcuB
MNRNLVTIGESSSCRDAVARMHRAQVRHLPVLKDDGTLVGVITDRDLRHHLFSPPVYHAIGTSPIDTLLQAARVSEIMSAPAVTVESSQDIAEAAGVMLRDKIGSLPVIEGGRLVGIITETDLLREICRADQACSPEVTDVVVSYP